MDGWMDGWIDGWMDRWMDGWMDGALLKLTLILESWIVGHGGNHVLTMPMRC